MEDVGVNSILVYLIKISCQYDPLHTLCNNTIKMAATSISSEPEASGKHQTSMALKKISSLGERPECFANTTAEILFVLAATMSVGMSSILIGGLTVVTADIGRDLNMTNAEITWISAAPSLAAGSFLLFFGKVADMTSRRWQFIGSMLLFAIFCLGTGFAKTGISFDILLGILGLLSAAAVPPAIGSIGAVYPKPCKRKNYAFACFSAGNPLGFVFGSVACGVCAQILSWRAYLYFIAIIYLAFAIIAFFTTPPDHEDKKPLNWSTLKSFDIIGTILTIAGFGLLSAALTQAGDAPDGWKTPYVIVMLVLGIVLIIVFLFWETKAPSPLLPMWVWRDRDFSFLLLILFLGFGAFGAAEFWITLYLQRFVTSSALMVAVYILPMAIMGTIVNIIAGMVLHKVSNKLLMLIGTSCYAISFLLLGLNRDGDLYWYFIFWAFCLVVWGADLQFNVANMYVMTALPSSHQSTGGGIFQMVSKLASAIFMGVTTAIYNAVLQNPPTTGYLANQNMAPYSAVFYFCSGICFFSLIFIPFLRVGTQGGLSKSDGDTEKHADNADAVDAKDVQESIVASEHSRNHSI